jgi:hypothetical protein
MSALTRDFAATPYITTQMHTPQLHYLGAHIKKKGLGGGEEHTGFWQRNGKEKDYLEDIRVDGRIILNWIKIYNERSGLD